MGQVKGTEPSLEIELDGKESINGRLLREEANEKLLAVPGAVVGVGRHV